MYHFNTVAGKEVTAEELRKAKEPYLLKKCGLVKFARKSGKVDVVMEGLGFALLHIWAYQNCTKTKDVAIWCKDTGEVLFYLEGRPDGMPEDSGFKPDNMHITDLCPALAEI